jgi:hypothetical protein
MRRCLVVAHQTLDSPRLEDAMADEVLREPATFHLVVPLFRPDDAIATTDLQVRAAAQERLNRAVSGFRSVGFLADGELGEPNPVEAVRAVVERDGVDTYSMVLVSTLPRMASRWLRIDVPSRIARATGLPVSHVEAPARVPR